MALFAECQKLTALRGLAPLSEDLFLFFTFLLILGKDLLRTASKKTKVLFF